MLSRLLAQICDRIDHGVDDAARPFKQGHASDRLPPDHRRERAGHEQGLDLRLDDALGVQPLEAYDAGVGQHDRREPHVAPRDRDLLDARPPGAGAEERHEQQALHLDRRLAVAVHHLLAQQVDVVVLAHLGQPLVHLQPQPLAGDVLVGQVGVDGQLDPYLAELRLAVALELVHGLADQPDVEVEPDVGDVAGLLAAEQVAGAADLEVLHGDGHAAAEVGVLGQGGQPLVGGLGERLLLRVEEVGVGPLARTADPAAQLVQLREPEGVGPLDDHRVGVGDVEAGLDDRRADQHVEAPLPEVQHHLLELVLPHLAVRHARPEPRAPARGSWPRPSRCSARGCGCRRPGPRAAARGVRRPRRCGPRSRRRRSAPGAAPPAAW